THFPYTTLFRSTAHRGQLPHHRRPHPAVHALRGVRHPGRGRGRDRPTARASRRNLPIHMGCGAVRQHGRADPGRARHRSADTHRGPPGLRDADLTNQVNTHVTRHPRTTLLACCSSLFLSSLDTSALVIALPALQDDLDLDITALQWVVVANALARGSTLFLAGSLADRYGPRRIFRIGVALFGAASLL